MSCSCTSSVFLPSSPSSCRPQSPPTFALSLSPQCRCTGRASFAAAQCGELRGGPAKVRHATRSLASSAAAPPPRSRPRGACEAADGVGAASLGRGARLSHDAGAWQMRGVVVARR
jgi:hypothetical protein